MSAEHPTGPRLPPVPGTEGTAPDSGERFVPEPKVSAQMAHIARSRARAWRFCVRLFTRPDEALLGQLRSGEMVDELRSATDWLGDEAGRFLDTDMVLGVFQRRARRRTLEQDLQDLVAEYDRLFPDGLGVLGAFRDLADVAESEADAWTGGHHEHAKALRVRQQQMIESELIDTVPEWAAQIDTATTRMFYRSSVRFTVSHLSLESGRDFDSALFGSGTPLTFDSEDNEDGRENEDGQDNDANGAND